MKRQTLAAILTGLSLMLLIGLLVFWLQRTYNQQQAILKKEVGFAFSSSVNFVQDSMVSAIWKEHLSDSTFIEQLNTNLPGNVATHLQDIDSLTDGNWKSMSVRLTRRNQDGDTTTVEEESGTHLFKHQRPPGPPSDSRAYARDSGRQFSHQMWTYKRSMGQIKFLMTGNDSIRVELDSSDIAHMFHQNLMRQDIDLPMNILIDQTNPYRSSKDGKIYSLAIPAGHPVQFFTGEVSGTVLFILMRMKFEIAFSLLLILLVLMSYWVIWKNLQSQKKLYTMRNDLIANITHELKTPVSTVHVALEAIQNFGVIHDKEKTRSYLSMAQSELDRLNILINKILKVKEFEDGQLNLDLQDIHLQDLIAQVQSALDVFITEKSAHLDVHLPDSDIIVRGDNVHLTNAIINLIENAIKYSGTDASVNISVEQDQCYASISIEDNGPGIPAVYQDKIFDRFFRVPHDNRHNIKGHGLGLSYVKEVVESHGGQIVLDRSNDNGSRFIMKLPIHYDTD